ncbi:Uncharacterised protein [Clostridioides difficile]|nr:Uncharacterised protein [Clostridioides difficile]
MNINNVVVRILAERILSRESGVVEEAEPTI